MPHAELPFVILDERQKWCKFCEYEMFWLHIIIIIIIVWMYVNHVQICLALDIMRVTKFCKCNCQIRGYGSILYAFFSLSLSKCFCFFFWHMRWNQHNLYIYALQETDKIAIVYMYNCIQINYMVVVADSMTATADVCVSQTNSGLVFIALIVHTLNVLHWKNTQRTSMFMYRFQEFNYIYICMILRARIVFNSFIDIHWHPSLIDMRLSILREYTYFDHRVVYVMRACVQNYDECTSKQASKRISEWMREFKACRVFTIQYTNTHHMYMHINVHVENEYWIQN